MATDSAIASLPHALVAAHRRFCDAVLDLPNQTSTNAALEALRGFVYELRKIPALSAELDRRDAFIKNGCGDGSSWRQAADKALAILSKPLETNDLLRVVRLQAGMGAIRSGVGGTEQLRNVIDALDVALNSTGLSEPSKSTLRECRRLSDALYNEAISLRADGCQTLKHAYEDLEVESTNQSGTVCILQAVPAMFPSICEAADSLLHWAAGDGKATRAKRSWKHLPDEPMPDKFVRMYKVCDTNKQLCLAMGEKPTRNHRALEKHAKAGLVRVVEQTPGARKLEVYFATSDLYGKVSEALRKPSEKLPPAKSRGKR